MDTDATVTVREYPGTVFKGKVARSAGALDENTRTMTTEVRVPNPDGKLFAGMFADVHLNLPVPHNTFELPATAIVTDARGVRVAIVRADGTVHLVPVVVERDLGSTVQVSNGIDATLLLAWSNSQAPRRPRALASKLLRRSPAPPKTP